MSEREIAVKTLSVDLSPDIDARYLKNVTQTGRAAEMVIARINVGFYKHLRQHFSLFFMRPAPFHV
ncbi:hypothetical protein CES85_5370 [Ochrobactrum quorumnocens]|uniref:Uncharacterized protein n=1 Tax=Ochrobactrum quorumnocens TaxID=271865 RepID=A0A248UCW4_9HYPH|nr:hypothetical protein CES85_5370 [[Ochrobactrum] quorumnocens]